MNKSDVLELATLLISKPSLTPNDAGCQTILAERLSKSGFHVEQLRYNEVDNLWARYGNSRPVFVFAGHTDVVPTGPLEKWSSPPFQPEIRDGKLYGRGAADMKSSIAAMIVACENFLKKNPSPPGSIAFLITSDEEGPAINGTAKVVDYLKKKGEKIDYCLIGEASSEKALGDTIKIGRRGSFHGKLVIHGKQGHIAYPQLADNPIHHAFPALLELCKTVWDKGNAQFPPTCFQISNIHAGTGADNVIPGNLEVTFNFRYCTESTPEQLQQRVEKILRQYPFRYDITWRISAYPFLTPQKELIKTVHRAIHEICDIEPHLSTTGGTSDGRFIATLGCQLVEMGPNNQSIHQIDEHISVKELEKLTTVYERILELTLR